MRRKECASEFFAGRNIKTCGILFSNIEMCVALVIKMGKFGPS